MPLYGLCVVSQQDQEQSSSDSSSDSSTDSSSDEDEPETTSAGGVATVPAAKKEVGRAARQQRRRTEALKRPPPRTSTAKGTSDSPTAAPAGGSTVMSEATPARPPQPTKAPNTKSEGGGRNRTESSVRGGAQLPFPDRSPAGGVEEEDEGPRPGALIDMPSEKQISKAFNRNKKVAHPPEREQPNPS